MVIISLIDVKLLVEGKGGDYFSKGRTLTHTAGNFIGCWVNITVGWMTRDDAGHALFRVF